MAWTQFLDQTFTLTGGEQYGQSEVSLSGLTGRKLVIKATNALAEESWTRAGTFTFQQHINALEVDLEVAAQTPAQPLFMDNPVLIDVPLSVASPYQLGFHFLYWHSQMRLEVWQNSEGVAPLPGELKHLAFGVGTGGWTDDNGYYWIVAAGQTIGKPGSGATYQGNHLKRLYEALWPYYPVTNKGSSATFDWSASRSLTLPDPRGRVIVSAGQGATLTNRTIAQVFGTETHTLTTGEMPSHSHSGASGAGAFFMSPGSGGSFTVSTTAGTMHRTQASTGTAGSGNPHNNMQPSFVACTVIATGEKYDA